MFPRPLARMLPVFLAVFYLAAQDRPRPLTPADFNGWRSISNQRLSPDGRWVAYGVFPQEGDGEVVVRNLATGREIRENAGVRPAPPASDPETEAPPQQRTVDMRFTADSKYLVFGTFPAKAETDKAKQEKKTEELSKGGMVLMDLGAMKATRIERVQSFQVPLRGGNWVAYLREAPVKAAEAAKPPADDSDQQRGGRPAASSRTRRPEFGSEMVLRALAGGQERSFADVVEYSLSHDGETLVYTVSGKAAEANGIYQAKVGSTDAPAALLAGKGKYAHIAWDDRQTQLAFVSDRDDAAARQPKWKLYRWERANAAAVEIVSAASPGFRPNFGVSDRGTLSFSRDGSRLFFACAPPSARRSEAATSDDRAVMDLWHWKDDYIQPMQKVRAERERNKTYSAVYLMGEKKVVQLGDPSLSEIVATDGGGWTVGTDDRAYRRGGDYGERFTDLWAVDLTTGDRRLLERRVRGAGNLSPDGRYALFFDGKDWNSVAVPGGTRVNLTASLGVRFLNEEYDSPGMPPPYGLAGWTRDGGKVLLYDRFDLWQVAPDGSGAENVTRGAGRARNLQFRLVRFPDEDNPRDRWIDPAQPLFLRAEHQETRDTGFFRTRFGASDAPRQLAMQARGLSAPVKAKNADVYLLTGQSFTESPDLLTAGPDFATMRKVSDINPQQKQFIWGTASLVRFKNIDGVPLAGVLYKPANFDPKKKYPLLVYIYERLSQTLNRYVEPRHGHNISIPHYVSNGYLVLQPDIVYTVGYPGQSALKAVLPAIQAVVDQGSVDEQAIGIQGHSWGGYQIAYMVTQTNRFRAAAAGAPVANMISAYDGIRWGPGLPRQFQYEIQQSRIGGTIWQYPTRFIENSPIFWADRVQTPLLMLHNDGDDAVPWYQGIEYYLALRRLGKEVYFFNYNGEPHGLRKRPNQKDYTLRMQQYFDHFLKGAPAPAWMEKGIPYLERDQAVAGADARP
jgi:dipeptidyl aminopeptidase/acylaminoacyl peptidase